MLQLYFGYSGVIYPDLATIRLSLLYRRFPSVPNRPDIIALVSP
jgi:hypothetical protein